MNPSGSTYVPVCGSTNCDWQLLPEHRQGKNQYFPFADTTVALSVALLVTLPAMVGLERCLDQYAGIRCTGVRHCCYQSDDLYKEGIEGTSDSK